MPVATLTKYVLKVLVILCGSAKLWTLGNYLKEIRFFIPYSLSFQREIIWFYVFRK